MWHVSLALDGTARAAHPRQKVKMDAFLAHGSKCMNMIFDRRLCVAGNARQSRWFGPARAPRCFRGMIGGACWVVTHDLVVPYCSTLVFGLLARVG